ncbi:unnamed protein product [Orchesella dallaii]|uniref:Gustatory receptor n=1 Tax=Orchesella dallaii TaxID=48710 RepID=A0ABP1SA54_9HEXA
MIMTQETTISQEVLHRHVMEIEDEVETNPKNHNNTKKQSINIRNTSENTLHIYFNCCYYMLLLPFRPEYDNSTQKCTLGGSRYQKNLCYYIMWPLLITNDITKSIRKFMLSSKRTTMSLNQYCQIFASLLYSFKQLKFLWTAYKSKDDIQKYLNAVSTNSLLQKPKESCEHPNYIKRLGKYFGWKLLVLLCIFAVYFCNYFQIAKVIFFDYSHFVSLSRLRIFLGNSGSINGTELKTAVNILSSGVEVVFCLVALFDHFLVTLFFLLPIPLWNSVRNLERILIHSKSEMNWSEVLKNYEEIKLLSRFGNEVWGTLTLLWILDYSTHLILNFDQMVRSRSLVDMVLLFGSQGILIFALIMGAEITRMVERLKEHLLVYYKDGSEARDSKSNSGRLINELIDELKTFPVGIGSTGVYKLDYGFLSQLLCSVIVTLFVGVPPPPQL